MGSMIEEGGEQAANKEKTMAKAGIIGRNRMK
jgi:hypothetical protein